jgi:hypothetical protein
MARKVAHAVAYFKAAIAISLRDAIMESAGRPPHKTKRQLFEDCVWASSEDPRTKLVLLSIAKFFKAEALTSSMSYSQIARECSIDESTAKDIRQRVEGRWLTTEVGKGFKTAKGRQNLYRGRPCPPDLLEQVQRSFSNDSAGVAPDDREGPSATTSSYDQGSSETTPIASRGSRQPSSGSPGTTRTAITAKVEERERESLAEKFESVEVTDVAIIGSGFRLLIDGIKEAATLVGIPHDVGVSIAKVCAYDWAANGKVLNSPMAVVKKAMINHVRQQVASLVGASSDRPHCSSAPATVTNGSRLPSDWTLPSGWAQWVRDRYDVPDWRLEKEAEKFRDYYANSSLKVTELEAKWRRWWTNGLTGVATRAEKRHEARRIMEAIVGVRRTNAGE